MVLSTSEFTFEIEYIPGCKNVIADFGSRLIPESDLLEKSEEDFTLTIHHTETMLDFPVFSQSDMTMEDHSELQNFPFHSKIQDNQFKILLHGIWYTYVPISFRRPIYFGIFTSHAILDYPTW